MNEELQVKINQWKKSHGKVFITKIKGEEYIYRTLNVGECEIVLRDLGKDKQPEVEDVALKAILYPENFNADNITVELAKYLTTFILNSSKIFKPEGIAEVISIAKNELAQRLESDFFSWKLALLQILPGYSLSDLDKLGVQEFFNLLVLAEKLSGKKLINYGQIKEQKVKENLTKVDTTNLTVGEKFMSKSDLDQIAADQSTTTLLEHFKKHRGK